MSQKPINLTAPEVRAFLAGRKTQLRLPIKPQPPEDVGQILGPENYTSIAVNKDGEEVPGPEVWGLYSEDGDWGLKCPFKPGDHLWVRETWKLVPVTAYLASREDDGSMVPHQVSPDGNSWAVYKAGWTRSAPRPWKSSTQMPKWASRITLEVLNVRVEQLHRITEEDAMAEGVDFLDDACYANNDWHPTYSDPDSGGSPILRDGFKSLWDSIHAQRACWEANPWAWVLDLKTVSQSPEKGKEEWKSKQNSL